MRKIGWLVALLCGLGIASGSVAEENNSSLAPSTPALTPSIASSDQDIAIDKEVLTIAADLVRVEYDFVNKRRSTIKKRIDFQTPYYGFSSGHVCHPDYKVLPNLKAEVGGVPMEITRTIQARSLTKDAKYRDVTNDLKKLGFTIDEISNYVGVDYDCEAVGDADGHIDVSGKYKANLDKLVKDRLVSTGQPYPLWEVSDIYSFTKEFGPDETIHVVYEYEPVFANGNLGYPYVEYSNEGYSGNALRHLFTNLRRDDGCLVSGEIPDRNANSKKNLSFVYREITHNSTAVSKLYGPIKDFTLNLRKKNSIDIVSICFEGKFSTSDDLTLTSKIENYLPLKNIDLEFISGNISK